LLYMKKSQIFFISNIVFIIGIAFGGMFHTNSLYWYIFILFFITLIFFIPARRMKLIILFLVLFFVGIWRVGYSQILPKDDISKFHGMKAEIIGWVCEDPDERVGSMKLTICADEIGVGGKKEKVSGCYHTVKCIGKMK